MKIAIIEDDSYTRKMIAEFLKRDGMRSIETDDGTDALSMIMNGNPDIVILDVNLPVKSGYEICSLVRENPKIYGNPIILMLTGEVDGEKVKKGFKTGADDYIKKPFDVEELLLRIHSWSRRINKIEEIMKYKNILIDIENKNVFENDKLVNISAKEFEVLKYLITNKGLIVSREKLMKDVWEVEYYYGCKTVDMTIKRIKEKIKSLETYVEPISGIGYKLIK